MNKKKRNDIELKSKALTEIEHFSLTEIPAESLFRLGRIFTEGHRYGKHNWRQGDTKFLIERANHAFKHFLLWIHQLETGEKLSNEDDIAKVMWFCAIAMELERVWHINGHPTNP